MSSLNKIVKNINASLRATSFSDKRFASFEANGIVKLLPIQNKTGGYDYRPAELTDSGEGKLLAPDDTKVLQIYHKVNGIEYSLQRERHGNGNENIIRKANMSMMVFALRNKIKLSEEMLDLFILKGVPDKFNKTVLQELNISDCSIKHASTDFNSVQLFQREYGNKTYYLKPEHLFFEVKYQIECRMKKSCINTCEPS